MPDKDKADPSPGETERGFKPGEDQRYQTDLLSRGDEEGVPAEDADAPDELAEDPRVLEAGEAGGYQTDAFSRGDREGVPQEDLRKREITGRAASEPSESTQRKHVDDADSRDAPPLRGPEGGVR